jgi:sialate O-acetylesterase
MTNARRRYAAVLMAGFAILMLIAGKASAEIRLPNLLSDHAVLQRESPIHLWGWATPGARLTIHLHEQRTSTIADELGQWTTWLSPEHAGGP